MHDTGHVFLLNSEEMDPLGIMMNNSHVRRISANYQNSKKNQRHIFGIQETIKDIRSEGRHIQMRPASCKIKSYMNCSQIDFRYGIYFI